MTHGAYGVVWHRMAHASWEFVMSHGPWVMEKKSLKGLPKGHGFMGLKGSLPSHLQHLQLHLIDVFNVLHCVLANTVHRVAHHLEVIQDLLKELCPLLLLCSLRNQLRCCQLPIELNHVNIPLAPWP